MALEGNIVTTDGTKVKIKAKTGSADAVELECVEGEITVDFGKRDVKEHTYLKGKTRKSTGNLKFGDGELKGSYKKTGTDAAQTLLLQALNKEGDFASDSTLIITIEDDDTSGSETTGTTLSFEVKITGVQKQYQVEDDIVLSASYTQLTAPVVTVAA